MFVLVQHIIYPFCWRFVMPTGSVRVLIYFGIATRHLWELKIKISPC